MGRGRWYFKDIGITFLLLTHMLQSLTDMLHLSFFCEAKIAVICYVNGGPLFSIHFGIL